MLPIDVLFNKIEFFSDLRDFIGKSLPDDEKVDIIYIILNRCGVFQDSLLKWNKRTAATQTYNEMKKFFRQEHLDLDKVGALTKQTTSLNHSKIMAQQEKLIDQMEARLKLNLVEAINQFATTYQEPEPSPSTTKMILPQNSPPLFLPSPAIPTNKPTR